MHFKLWASRKLCFDCKYKFKEIKVFIVTISVGQDAAFIGPNDNQFVILDEDKTGVALYVLPGGASVDVAKKNELAIENPTAVIEDDTDTGSVKGPIPFMFDTEVDRIFSTPIGA